ncbi:MAG TPA: malonyl CoA-acyl carrier protein transacylase, partial [Candidatus Polarisedimenticolia bacterium]|nr:malonyl CoA-acyl carrier protein transacylase [Candidatus Polarisedimenticolia bacterium]
MVNASRRIALVFPGQGSQAVGMGAAIAAVSPEAREVFERADAALGF